MIGNEPHVGPLAQAIIDHDRQSEAVAAPIRAAKVVHVSWGHVLRENRVRRAELTAAAAAICNRPAAPSPTGGRTASMRG